MWFGRDGITDSYLLTYPLERNWATSEDFSNIYTPRILATMRSTKRVCIHVFLNFYFAYHYKGCEQ